MLFAPPLPAPPAAAAPPVGGGWVCVSLGFSWLSFSLCLLYLFVRVCIASALRLRGGLLVFVEVLVDSLSSGSPSSLSVLSSSFAARARALIGFVLFVLCSASLLLPVSGFSWLSFSLCLLCLFDLKVHI